MTILINVFNSPPWSLPSCYHMFSLGSRPQSFPHSGSKRKWKVNIKGGDGWLLWCNAKCKEEDCKILQAVLLQFILFFFYCSCVLENLQRWKSLDLCCDDLHNINRQKEAKLDTKALWASCLHADVLWCENNRDKINVCLQCNYDMFRMVTDISYHFKLVLLSLDVTLSSQPQPNIW